jgi:hypothetical protein
MSRWTHSICSDCWQLKNPDREPTRIVDATMDACCYCGADHTSGIYLRDDPSALLCFGAHGAPTPEPQS